MKLKMQDLRLFNLVFESEPGWMVRILERHFKNIMTINYGRHERSDGGML